MFWYVYKLDEVIRGSFCSESWERESKDRAERMLIESWGRRWRLRALEKFEPDRWINRGKQFLSYCRSQKNIKVISVDTNVVLKDDYSNVFETLMVFIDSGISLKCQFNGANDIIIPVDKDIGNFG